MCPLEFGNPTAGWKHKDDGWETRQTLTADSWLPRTNCTGACEWMRNMRVRSYVEIISGLDYKILIYSRKYYKEHAALSDILVENVLSQHDSRTLSMGRTETNNQLSWKHLIVEGFSTHFPRTWNIAFVRPPCPINPTIQQQFSFKTRQTARRYLFCLYLTVLGEVANWGIQKLSKTWKGNMISPR